MDMDLSDALYSLATLIVRSTPRELSLTAASTLAALDRAGPQRITALALVFLTLWFVITVLGLMHTDYATARATIAKPWNAVLLIALIVTMFKHAVLGLQVVIEDYVHTRWLEMTSLVLIKFIAVLAALTGVLAVLRIALGS